MSPSITPSSPRTPLAQLQFSRRGFLGLGAGLGAAVGLSACAVDPQQTGQGTPEGSVRFAWWGNDSRQRIFTEFAEGFTGGTVRAEPSEYSGYVDRLNVQAAGSNLPDVFWIPANLAQTYASRGALLDLDSVADGVDYSAYDPQVVESWKLDGDQYAPVYSQYSVCAQLDTTALSAAGITDLPDDESWTWDDLSTLAAAYAQARGEGNWGIANQASFYQHAHLWIRQQGAEVFTSDGQVGFDADVIGTWFDFWRRATDAGGVMPTEVSAGQTQWTQTAGRTAMYLVQLNQVQDNVAFSEGSELQLVKSPAPAGTSGDYQFQYYTRLCTAGSTGDPEMAAAFIDYSLNDPSNAEVVGLASGIPSNPDVVALIREQGDPTATKILDITERIDPDAGRARPEPPVGGADWQRAIETAADNIFNAGADIASESQQAVASIQAALERG